jgi:hypothetical protein
VVAGCKKSRRLIVVLSIGLYIHTDYILKSCRRKVGVAVASLALRLWSLLPGMGSLGRKLRDSVSVAMTRLVLCGAAPAYGR